MKIVVKIVLLTTAQCSVPNFIDIKALSNSKADSDEAIMVIS